MRFRRLFFILYLIGIIDLIGCASSTSNESNVLNRVEMKFNFIASDWVNLNALNQSSPIQVYLLPLKSAEKFSTLPQKEILINFDKLLAADLIGPVREVILMPGEELAIKWPAPCPGFIGVLSNFRAQIEVENDNKQLITCTEKTWTNWSSTPTTWQISLSGNSMKIKSLKFYGLLE